MTEPFLYKTAGSLSYDHGWWDDRTGGADWSFLYAWGFPDGYRPVGDLVYQAYIKGHSIDLNKIFDAPNHLLVNTNRPDAAIPCTGYDVVKTITNNKYKAKIYLPVNPDKNYVALGHVVRLDVNPPQPGAYYLVHRKYVIDRGHSAALFWDSNDKMPCYRTVNGTNVFRYNDNYKYDLRTDTDLVSCCTGTGQDCELWTKGSVGCQAALGARCSAADIKPGGACVDWCDRDPVSCDKLKTDFCRMHPADPLCDCINATTRADYAELIKDKEIVYNLSTPACFYPKCKLGAGAVFTTTEMVEAQNGERCSRDIKYIDQQIKVIGNNNVLDTHQIIQEAPPTSNSAIPVTNTKITADPGNTIRYNLPETLNISTDFFSFKNPKFLMLLVVLIILSAFFIESDNTPPPVAGPPK